MTAANAPSAWLKTRWNTSSLTATTQQRQDWISVIKVMLQQHHPQQQTQTWRLDNAREEVYTELQDIFTRHPYKQFLWRGLWPNFLRERQATLHTSGFAMGKRRVQENIGTGSATVQPASVCGDARNPWHSVQSGATNKRPPQPAISSEHPTFARIPNARKNN